MLTFPATTDQLRKAGYEYDNDARCRGCDAEIEWWITPAGKKMPMSIVKAPNVLFESGDKRQPHFADCPDAKRFRK